MDTTKLKKFAAGLGLVAMLTVPTVLLHGSKTEVVSKPPATYQERAEQLDPCAYDKDKCAPVAVAPKPVVKPKAFKKPKAKASRFTCEQVRYWAGKLTQEQMLSLAERFGVTEREKRQAQACLNNKG